MWKCVIVFDCVQTCGVLFKLKMRHTYSLFICKHAFQLRYENIWRRKYVFHCILFSVFFIFEKPWAKNNKYLEQLLSQGGCRIGVSMAKWLAAMHAVAKRTKLFSEWFFRKNVPFQKKVFAFKWITLKLNAKRVHHLLLLLLWEFPTCSC